MASLIEKVLKTGDKRTLKQLRGYADAVNLLAEEFSSATDAQLRQETDRFKERLADGESLDSLLPEAFAVVREAADRTLGQRHFDVQIMGGTALHLGNIAEMGTGEGKTLVATSPAYLNALTGEGVHVVTVNDYLAKYQAELMGRVYRFLGLSTGVITNDLNPAQRREAYAADITYGTNNEFGFDFLRDNMAQSLADVVQRNRNFAIIDEIDSILIDEARTPLIISGAASGTVSRWYSDFATIAGRLSLDQDYEVDEKKKTVGVLESGIDKVEDYLGIENLYETENTTLIQYLNNAIRAKELYQRDTDYVVVNQEVHIVDEHTGRVLKGRRYSEGLHQAIEAKEGVKIKPENQTRATVTLQNYFRDYKKLSGMTGTAETEAAEFMSTYKLGVVSIPPNRQRRRADHNDLVYKNEIVKFEAVAQDIMERHKTGQPVLVGTESVEKSEYLSKLLAKNGVRHEVLNAKNHEREAAIVAQAGRQGSVTVATNMAGRGTDIMLGGNAEFNAVHEMEKLGLDPEKDAEEYEKTWDKVFAEAKTSTEQEAAVVKELGGLYVLGTERHQSRRIDNQLRGRSGRQGDPGESRFYVSLTDNLMRLFNQSAAQRIMNSSALSDDVPVEHKLVSSAIANAQQQRESQNAETRKNVLKYDDVLNRQRQAIYTDRRRILEGDDVHDTVQQFLKEALELLIDQKTTASSSEDWELEQLWEDLAEIYPIQLEISDLVEEAGGIDRLSVKMLKREVVSDAQVAYEAKEREVGAEALRQLEPRVLLTVIDEQWQEHLYEMDYLKSGIGLRSMAQRDPLVEYQREGYLLFQAMADDIREKSVQRLFQAQVQPVPAQKPVTLPGVADGRLAASGAATQVSVTGLTGASGTATTGG